MPLYGNVQGQNLFVRTYRNKRRKLFKKILDCLYLHILVLQKSGGFMKTIWIFKCQQTLELFAAEQ